jgi:hypothetical protein
MLSNIWVWDPGSEIRKKPIPDPGVKKAPDPGSGSATLLLTQKIVTKLSKIWVWDQESEIWDSEKTYSGFRGQKGTGSRIRNTALIR